jgi:carbon starvation protein
MAVPFFAMATADEGMYTKFWTLFGASNQLLAALTLLSITVWLYHARKRIAFTLFPMIFVLIITLWALSSITLANFRTTQGLDVQLVNGIAAGALILLALFVAFSALVRLRSERGGGGVALTEPVRPSQ